MRAGASFLIDLIPIYREKKEINDNKQTNGRRGSRSGRNRFTSAVATLGSDGQPVIFGSRKKTDDDLSESYGREPPQRPAFSVLNTESARTVVPHPARHWRHHLRSMLDELRAA